MTYNYHILKYSYYKKIINYFYLIKKKLYNITNEAFDNAFIFKKLNIKAINKKNKAFL